MKLKSFSYKLESRAHAHGRSTCIIPLSLHDALLVPYTLVPDIVVQVQYSKNWYIIIIDKKTQKSIFAVFYV